MARLAAYGRVSGLIQEKEETITTQFDVIDTWASKKGHVIVEYYQDTNCRNTVPIPVRRDGARLLRDAREGKFDGVVICVSVMLSLV